MTPTAAKRELWSLVRDGLSARHAPRKFAGHNAVNVMFGKEPISYLQSRYATCLDLGPENALLTNGWERNDEMYGREAKGMFFLCARIQKAYLDEKGIRKAQSILHVCQGSNLHPCCAN